MALAVLSVVAGIGLAVYLFVIGIMVLRDSLRGRRLHQIYAGLALVLIVMETSAAWWLASSFSDELAKSGSNPFTAVTLGRGISLMVLLPHGIVAVLGCIYPIVLLILLQTAGVKAYYRNSVG
jgi:hypothetical protein